MAEEERAKHFREFEKKAEQVVQSDAKFNSYIERAKSLASKLSSCTDEFLEIIQMVILHHEKKYEIQPETFIAFLAAIIYVVSPFDAIPDWIPYLGWTDDVLVLKFVFSYYKSEIQRFRAWKSNEENQKTLETTMDHYSKKTRAIFRCCTIL